MNIENDDKLLDEVTKQAVTECRIKGMGFGAIVKKFKITQVQLNSFLKGEIRNYLTASTMDDAQGAWRDLAMSRLEAIVEQIFPLLMQEGEIKGKKMDVGGAQWKSLLDSLLRVLDQQADLVGAPAKAASASGEKAFNAKSEPELLAEAKAMGIPTN